MKKENRKSYPSDLTDRQWKEIESLYTGMRRCKWSKRNYRSHLKRAIRFLEEFSFSPAPPERTHKFLFISRKMRSTLNLKSNRAMPKAAFLNFEKIYFKT